jgi:hypothetical protein
MTTAISTASLINSLGINTHIDFDADGYQNLATVEAAIKYLGLHNIRDSAQTAADASAWLQVANATGAKFDDYIGETSPSGMQTDLGFVAQLAQEGVLNFLEGGNEEDDSYPASLGNSLGYTAQFQQQVYATAHEYGLKAINMSFGAGWTAANDWHGDYDKVGNLSAYADYANAHTYPQAGQTTDSSIQQLNSDALLAAGSRQVITTEIGWNTSTFNQGAIAQYVVQAALDGIKDGGAMMYYYALFNDSSGNYGLMNADGSATPAGTALHDLTTLLADTGSNAASFTPGSLNYSLSGQQSTDNTLLMQKSDGSDWIAVWDESAATHTVTLQLPSAAAQIEVYDPVTGTSAIASATNASSISLSLGNDPLLVEVIPSGSAASTGSSSGSGSSSGGTTGTSAGSGASSTSGSGTTSTSGASPAPVLTAPASESVAAGGTAAITGVSLSDLWAAGNAGTLALNVTTSGGTVSMTDASGGAVSGSGTSAIHVSGTLAQINADLTTLSYAAGNSNASITVNVWDQGGAQATRSIGVTVGSGTTGGSSSSSGGTTTSTISIAPSNADPVENVSNAAITASAGDHLIFIGGTGNTLTATGGTETVQAFQGGNTITTGAGNDKIYFSGSNNVVNAGAGNNALYDSGTNNTIVLPAANQGYDDIYGYMMTNGDKFDMRGLLASTSWNGDLATIGNYVAVTPSGTGSVIQVDPSGVAGGASYVAATLEAAGPVSLSTLLAHAIT